MADITDILYGAKDEARERSMDQVVNQDETLDRYEEYKKRKEREAEDRERKKIESERIAGSNAVGGAEQKDQWRNNFSDQALGSLHGQSIRNYETQDERSVGTDYSAQNFFEQGYNNFLAGVGESIIGGTGDMIQALTAIAIPSLSEGTILSRWLQEMGDDFAGEFKAYLPPNLDPENLGWRDLADPEFWSTHVAKMMPQILEFVYLSKGASSVARSGARKIAKKIPNKSMLGTKTATAMGKNIAYKSGTGVAGKLMTDRGLTVLGEQLAGAVGGGLSQNLLAGLQNAAEVINENVNAVDADGNRLYTDEELSKMASGTVLNNLAWIGFDAASFGLTYGGGWKALGKGLKPMGNRMIKNAVERNKMLSSMFKYEMSPIAKNIAKYSGTMASEAIEETFQESWEEWAKKKAFSDATGTAMQYDNYFDFYMSDENRATKILAAAGGLAGGGMFNMRTLINRKADESYLLYDRAANLEKVLNGQGTELENAWNRFHKQDQIAEIVIDEKSEHLESMLDYWEEQGYINAEQRAEYEKMHDDFVDVKEKGERLNVTGLKALMRNKALENFAQSEIDLMSQRAVEKIEAIEQSSLSEEEKAEAIEKELQSIESRLKSATYLQAEAKQNQENLIIGKPASELNVDIKLDEFGNEMVIAGLSDSQTKRFTLEEGESLAENIEKYIEEQSKGKSAGRSLMDLAESLFNSAKNKFNQFRMPKDPKSRPDVKPEEATETEQATDREASENVSEDTQEKEVKYLNPGEDSISNQESETEGKGKSKGKGNKKSSINRKPRKYGSQANRTPRKGRSIRSRTSKESEPAGMDFRLFNRKKTAEKTPSGKDTDAKINREKAKQSQEEANRHALEAEKHLKNHKTLSAKAKRLQARADELKRQAQRLTGQDAEKVAKRAAKVQREANEALKQSKDARKKATEANNKRNNILSNQQGSKVNQEESLVRDKDYFEKVKNRTIGKDETVSDEEFDRFIKNPHDVRESTLQRIADKISRGEKLTGREAEIYDDNRSAVYPKTVENYLKKFGFKGRRSPSSTDTKRLNEGQKRISRSASNERSLPPSSPLPVLPEGDLGYIQAVQQIEQIAEDRRDPFEKKLSQLNKYLSDLRSQKATIADIDKFLKEFINEFDANTNQDINEIVERVEYFQKTLSSPLFSKGDIGTIYRTKLDRFRNMLKEEFKFGNEIMDRIRLQQESQNQIDQIIADVENQIQYYKNLRHQGPVTQDSIRENIKTLEANRSNLVRTSNNIKKAINSLKDMLSNLVDISFGKARTLDSFKAFTDFKPKDATELKKSIDEGTADNYASLKKTYDDLSSEVNKALDNVENTEKDILIREQQLNNINDKISRIDNNLRYLNELLETIPATEQTQTTTDENVGVEENIQEDTQEEVQETVEEGVEEEVVENIEEEVEGEIDTEPISDLEVRYAGFSNDLLIMEALDTYSQEDVHMALTEDLGIDKDIDELTREEVLRLAEHLDLEPEESFREFPTMDTEESTPPPPSMDARSLRKLHRRILSQNKHDFVRTETTRQNIRRQLALGEKYVSKNALDAYLNRFLTENFEAPGSLHKMAAVNHALKRAFPETADPVNAFIVRNLYEAVGSQGMGNIVAGTIVIDEKAWEQDQVFMHEVGHVYFRLTKNDPMTQMLLRTVMNDQALMNEMYKLYDDYVYYNVVNNDGDTIKMTKRAILKNLMNSGFDSKIAESIFEQFIQNEEISESPLAEQDLILEEGFARALQGPLAKHFDKNFFPKEQKRQKDVKMWWGMIKKRGEVIQSDGYVERFLNNIAEANQGQTGSLADYILKNLRSITHGVSLDGISMDSRAERTTEEYREAINEIARKKESQRDNPIIFDRDMTMTNEELDSVEMDLEEDGMQFYTKDFESLAKRSTAILRNYTRAMNHMLGRQFANKVANDPTDQSKRPYIDSAEFIKDIYMLVYESINGNDFIYNLKNSEVKTLSDFYNYIDKSYGGSSYRLLSSMHYVLSNQKPINSSMLLVDPEGKASTVAPSLSSQEVILRERIAKKINNERKRKTASYLDAYEIIDDVQTGINLTDAQAESLLYFLSDRSIDRERILKDGYLTYKGRNIPIKDLFQGFIREKNPIRETRRGSKYLSTYDFNPIIEAIIDTNTKFSPFSTSLNAEGQLESSRITKNNLTREVDGMIEYLSPDENGEKPTKEEFLDRYSHIIHPYAKELGRRYVPNQFLEYIYDQFQKGEIPQFTQDRGIKNISSEEGQVFRHSSSTEQGLIDFLTFYDTSHNTNGKRKLSYMANMGTFSDSPRKFYMTTRVIPYNEVFQFNEKTGKMQFHQDGRIVNNAYEVFKRVFSQDERPHIMKARTNKENFKRSLVENANAFVKFLNENSEAVLTDKRMEKLFTNGKLNNDGRRMAYEYTINSVVNGMNMAEVFMPGVKGENIAKRFKGNSSPNLSINNPNFKMELVPFADEIVDGSIAGTDSGMYIRRQDAEKMAALGEGVFDQNNGFKFLNTGVDKSNPKLKGQFIYGKGYTTVIDEGHPLYNLLTERHNKWVNEVNNGQEPSFDFNDGTPNFLALAMPVSADKTGFVPRQLTKKKDGKYEYAEGAHLLTPSAIAENTEAAHKLADEMYYVDGTFFGMETSHFGPQQTMDKITNEVNTPNQMENAIMVNSAINNNIEKAEEIQALIAAQKQLNLEKEFEQLQDRSIESYTKFIEERLNKQDMDQIQRYMIETGVPINHPYVAEIITNQLNKTVRSKGNKLYTPGTLAQQKPDLGYATNQVFADKRLKGMQTATNGGTIPGEMRAPKHLMGKINARKYYTLESHKEALQKASSEKSVEITNEQKLESLKALAIKEAKFRASQEFGDMGRFNELISEEFDSKGNLIGYHVKGERVIASRVPGHGPAATGVFEIVDFDPTDGNQVSVSGEFNEIISADNDGDALFIQTRGDKGYGNWNKAFRMMKEMWLSPEMHDQIRAKIDNDEHVKKVISNIEEKFGDRTQNYLPFSPMDRMVQYEDTNVSKRNVGPIFNIHKVSNLLAAYEVNLETPIIIHYGKNRIKRITRFEDRVVGEKSRNHQSAAFAQISMDNANNSFASRLGFNEATVPAATLLINLGFDLEQVGMIMNSDAAKVWTKHRRINDGVLSQGTSEFQTMNNIRKELGLPPLKGFREKQDALRIKPEDAHKESEAENILNLLEYLSNVNSTVSTIAGMMSGHKSLHVNPFLLENQLIEYNKLAENSKDSGITLNDGFKNNPSIKNYIKTAEKALEMLKELNPIYRDSTKRVFDSLNNSLNGRLSSTDIEKISHLFSQFNSSRLLGLNNLPAKDVLGLFKQDKKSGHRTIFDKIDTYISGLHDITMHRAKNVTENVSAFQNSLLFSRGINHSNEFQYRRLYANNGYINDNLSKEELLRMREEFAELPTEEDGNDLKRDLLTYDLIATGHKGKSSISPLFSEDIQEAMKVATKEDFNNKNRAIDDSVLAKLELVAIKKLAMENSGAIPRVFPPKGQETFTDRNSLIKAIKENRDVLESLNNGGPAYVVASLNGNRHLLIVNPYTDSQINLMNASKGNVRENIRSNAIESNTKSIRLDLQQIPTVPLGSFEASTIADESSPIPFMSFRDTRNRGRNYDGLVEGTMRYNDELSMDSRSMDAREDFYDGTFNREQELSRSEYDMAMEFDERTTEPMRNAMYEQYLKEKKAANREAEEFLPKMEKMTKQELYDAYVKYGQKDVYAYSVITSPLVKHLAQLEMNDHLDMIESKLGIRPEQGGDITKLQANMISGATIPSRHPASQALARRMEIEYKNYTSEKGKYTQRINEVTDALHREKFGYGYDRSFGSVIRRLGRNIASVFTNTNPYEAMYGNLVIRNEIISDSGQLTYDYKLKPKEEIERLHQEGLISDAEKKFYDTFTEITNELKPKGLNQEKENYIPHSPMSRFEIMASRGMLGLWAHSYKSDQGIYDVKMNYKNDAGEDVTMTFKQIEDLFKRDSASKYGANNIEKINEYRKIKKKAQRLLKSGKNEDGTRITFSAPAVETLLGFGAINRFANNRSVKATEIPSMDLSKVLSDYMQSTLFVHGNKKFQGMETLQGLIDGVLAYNHDQNLPNMNLHVQKVWKDYFLRNKRQESFLGKKADNVIRNLTRMNLFYALGYGGLYKGGGLYAIGNIIAGKFHNIKDLGGKDWAKGEARFWGLDQGLKGGVSGIMQRQKRMRNIMKNINFMDINVYDEVPLNKKNSLDAIIGDIALSPMIYSERWIQRVHMLGKMTDEELARFDDNGNYKEGAMPISVERITELEDSIKKYHGRGYQPTDQRAFQMYSWGSAVSQFARFIPTLFHEHWAKEDINIYGQETIGSYNAVKKMVQYVVNHPEGFKKYREDLSPEMRERLDQGMRGMAMSAILLFGGYVGNEVASDAFSDVNYYGDLSKMKYKMTPPLVHSINRIMF